MRSKIFAIRMSDKMNEKIINAAEELFISKSDFIRMAIAKQLNNINKAQNNQDLDWEKLFHDKN